jgi:signal recognition particle subunit SRP54
MGGGMPSPEMLAQLKDKLPPGTLPDMPGMPSGSGIPAAPPPGLVNAPKGPTLPGLGGPKLPGLGGLGGFNPFGGKKK